MPISSTITLQQVVAADSIRSNTGQIRTPNIQIPANLGNLGVKLRQQTTTSDFVSKGIRDGHAQKDNSHTTEDKIKGNNYNYFTGRVAWWLATCARKPKVPGSSPAASYA